MKEQRMKSFSGLCLETEVVQLYGEIFNMLRMIRDETDSPDAEEEI